MKTNLKYLPKPIAQALAKEEVLTKALFERPESLSALLPYDECIESSQVFRHKDGSLGAVFDVELLEHEPMTNEQIITAVDSLKSWFSLPETCVLQVLFDQSAISKDDSDFLEMAQSYPNSHPVSKALYDTKLSAIRQACNTEHPLAPLRRKTLVSIRYFPESSGSKLSQSLMKRGEAVLYGEMKGFVQAIRQFNEILVSFQQNSKVRLTRLGAAEVLDVLRKFFNPKAYYKRSFAPYNPNLPISDQLIYHSPVLDYAGIEREGIKTRTLTLKTSPQYAYPGGMAYFTRLPFPLKLSLNFSFPSRARVKAFFDMKEFFLQNTPTAKARRQQEEILSVQDRLARDDRCLHLTFSVVVEGETDDILESRVRQVVNVFHNDLECETILEDDIGLGLCLNSLPLNYNPRADYSTKRAIRILRSDATKFLPVFDSFRGLKNPLQLFLSRENNLVRFSLLENETSNHTILLADSGSGKSAFVLDVIQAAKRMDVEPITFVIDKKSSSVMLSEYFDGDLTVFDRDMEMPFSPFRGVYDEEKIAFLTNLITSCVKLTSPSFEVDSTHTGVIAKALKLAYRKKAELSGLACIQDELLKQATEDEVFLTMDDFVAELSALPAEEKFDRSGDQIRAFLERLAPFYGDGIYAQYFRGAAPSKRKKSKLFYVYDLDRLDTDPILQALMTMAVFEEIRRVRKLPENQGRTAFVILEELGMLGRNNPTAGPLILDFAETCRKLDMWLISLAPRAETYFELEAGRAMWSVADNFIFLRMNPDNVEYVAQRSALLNEADREIIKSLKTERGQYAEVFYMNKNKTKQGAFRYFQTAYDRWLAPTNAKDAREASQALKRFKDHKWQALMYLALKYPHGVEGTNKKAEEKSDEQKQTQ